MICQYKQCNKDVSTDTACQCERDAIKEQESLRCETEGLHNNIKFLWVEIESLKEQVKALQEYNVEENAIRLQEHLELLKPKQSAEDSNEMLRNLSAHEPREQPSTRWVTEEKAKRYIRNAYAQGKALHEDKLERIKTILDGQLSALANSIRRTIDED